MAGVSYVLRLDEVEGVEALARLAQADDLQPWMESIGTSLLTNTIDRFNLSNESPDGVPWPQSLRALADGGKTLLDAGHLRDSINTQSTATETRIGTNKIYAGTHQAGATIKRTASPEVSFTLAKGERATAGEITIPARPYLGISEKDKEDIGALTVAFFNNLLRG